MPCRYAVILKIMDARGVGLGNPTPSGALEAVCVEMLAWTVGVQAQVPATVTVTDRTQAIQILVMDGLRL